MTSTVRAPSTLRRAAVLMTLSSFLVPAAGIITAPILARALSADGRGELAAAMAPAALMLAAATLGLPDALTYHLAKRPQLTRPALGWASLITAGLGIVCFGATLASLPFLSAGSPILGKLILLAAALTVPALVVNVFRGAAIGRQMWTAVAVERVILTVARALGLGILFLAGHLTLLSAVLVGVATALIGGVVYLPLLRRPPTGSQPRVDEETATIVEDDVRAAEVAVGDVAIGDVVVDDAVDHDRDGESVLKMIVQFGSKVWLGSVASMLLSRAAQLLMTPLSSAYDLGLYSVASTISDLPLVVALAIQGALFGVNSKARDVGQVTGTSRLTLMVAVLGCAVMGISLPFWITLLFGEEFSGALLPTLMLLFSALVCIPGLMAATGLSAWGRPGLRSLGLTVTLVVNVGTFILVVPHLGVYGACWTSIVSNVVNTTFMILACRKVMGTSVSDFVAVRSSDVQRGWNEGLRLLCKIRAGRS